MVGTCRKDTAVLVCIMVAIWRVEITALEVGIVRGGIVAVGGAITAIREVGATASASAEGASGGGAEGLC